MTLSEIGGDPTRQRRTDFARREPWGAPTLRGRGNITTTTEGVTGDLTRRWAVGPANYLNYRKYVIILNVLRLPRWLPPPPRHPPSEFKMDSVWYSKGLA